MHAETRTSVLDGSTRNLVDPTVAAATATGSASGAAATCARAVKAVHDRTASLHRPTIRSMIASPDPATTLVRRVTVSSTTRQPAAPVNRARPTDSSRLTLTPAT